MNIEHGAIFEIYRYSVKSFFEEFQYIEIPLYQRDYVWNKEQIEILLEDIKARMSDGKEHFFGIIAKSDKIEKKDLTEITRHRIIDGQQRITTAIIIIHYLSVKIHELDFRQDGGFIKEFENMNFCNEINTTVSDIISNIVSKKSNLLTINPNSKVGSNWAIIDEFFKNQQQTSSNFKDFLSTFLNRFIFAILHYHIQPSDEMLIFENLNSKGAPLSDYDLIKNTIVSYFDKYEAKKNFQKLNDRVLNLLNIDQYKQKEITSNKIFENFIETYLIWKNSKWKIETFKSYKLYKNLKIYFEKNKNILTFESFIEDLRKYLILYLSVNYPSKESDLGKKLWFRVIKQRNFQMPFIFDIFNKYSVFENDEWNLKPKINGYMQVIASHIIKYVSVYGSDQNLGSWILKIGNWANTKEWDPNKIKKELKIENSDISVSDAQFIESCSREQKNNKWISWSIIDIIDSSIKNNNEKIRKTKEYIMPERPGNDGWPLFDTKSSTNKHKIYYHQIGNLLWFDNLLKKISGNTSFYDKKNQYYSKSNSCLITAKGLEKFDVKPLLEYDSWGFDEIKKRTKTLAQVSLKIMDDIELFS